MKSALKLAQYVVTKCYKEDMPISNLQLQTILYIIQTRFLQQGEQAFVDFFEAWQFGPIISEVYYHFSGYGAMPITNTYADTSKYTEGEYRLIDSIVENKRGLAPWLMMNKIRESGGAWDITFRRLGRNSHAFIPIKLITEDSNFGPEM